MYQITYSLINSKHALHSRSIVNLSYILCEQYTFEVYIIQIIIIISFMMYKLVNGLLPEVMNELYTTNDQIHDHFTRQYHFFPY